MILKWLKLLIQMKPNWPVASSYVYRHYCRKRISIGTGNIPPHLGRPVCYVPTFRETRGDKRFGRFYWVLTGPKLVWRFLHSFLPGSWCHPCLSSAWPFHGRVIPTIQLNYTVLCRLNCGGQTNWRYQWCNEPYSEEAQTFCCPFFCFSKFYCWVNRTIISIRRYLSSGTSAAL